MLKTKQKRSNKYLWRSYDSGSNKL